MSSTSKEKILEAADHLFGQLGFDATTTREIAEESGVNKALIHYHFKNKEALLGSLLDRYYHDLAETLGGALGAEGPLRDRLLNLIDSYCDFLADNRNFSTIVQREAAGGRHQEWIQARMVPIFEMGTQWVLAAFPTTVAGDLAAAHLLVSFYGMVVTYFTYSGVIGHLLGADPLGDAALAERKIHLHRMVDILLVQITATGEGSDR